MTTGADAFTVALVTEVFHGEDGAGRLHEVLGRARSMGAELAVLPELPLDRWVPATPRPSDDDAEEAGGRRHRALAEAARAAGVGVVGGAIVRDAVTGSRHNTALVFDASGRHVASYRKLHLPDEEGFWEARHYEPGDEPPGVIRDFPVAFGIQICSDVHRPDGCQLLAAGGAQAVLVPRATPPESYERWKLVLRANAVTGAVYVLSANRPRPEGRAAIGGASIAVAPDGEVVAEATDAVRTVTLRREAVARARADYPGYLSRRAGLWARAWSETEKSSRG